MRGSTQPNLNGIGQDLITHVPFASSRWKDSIDTARRLGRIVTIFWRFVVALIWRLDGRRLGNEADRAAKRWRV